MHLSEFSKLQSGLLKQIGGIAGIRKPFAHHSARHSYASQARDAKTPLSLICEALGYRDEKTTRIYLYRLDSSLLAKVNAKVMCKFTLDTGQKRRVCA
jgi:site-specific recombinase XerC